ncbi:TIGR00341 family protein [filamentous cyanobacterium CCP5]|nr:TIGR00341 family protein [filamentous cyanobacterium CCP5]
MRQLRISVPTGQGQQVLAAAQGLNAVNLTQMPAQGDNRPVDLVFLQISNRQVGPLLEQLEAIPNLQVSLDPHGSIALRPPAGSTPEQVRDVQGRSPIEIFLGGLQSVGSWWGFLAYAALGGVIVWIGLYTNTVYLLVAAMLIAPFAGPAMNMAIATARGDPQLIWLALRRYFAAIAVSVAVAALLSGVFQQTASTSLMFASSKIASVAVLLPLAAGAAGAINLVQSPQSSLVSGAAVGLLIAASLAPPSGILGMALVLGRWEMVGRSVFLLVLQLVGINLSAATIFRLKGLRPQGIRYSRGRQGVFPIALGVTAVALAGLLLLQFSFEPSLQRSSYAQRLQADLQEVVADSGLVYLVDSEVRFTDVPQRSSEVLLCLIYVQPAESTDLSNRAIRDRISDLVQTRLEQESQQILPLIDVTVLSR